MESKHDNTELEMIVHVSIDLINTAFILESFVINYAIW